VERLQLAIKQRPALNDAIKKQPGFMNKTWLSGAGNRSAGGFYVFKSIENAKMFVTDYFPREAKEFGVAQTTGIFDAKATEEASREMLSVHYGHGKVEKPGAFVYTQVQLKLLPFNKSVPWKVINERLREQPGLLSKTWLSGLHTGTPGGFYAFESLETARQFALEEFPKRAAEMDAAFYTRVFDASITESASRDMASPYY
jgi:hypothetical protein